MGELVLDQHGNQSLQLNNLGLEFVAAWNAKYPEPRRLLYSSCLDLVKIAVQYCQMGEDDLDSAGRTGLVQAAIRYREDKGKFESYLTWWCKSALQTYIGTRTLAALKPNLETGSRLDGSDVYDHMTGRSSATPEQIAEANESKAIARELLGCLDGRDQRLIALRYGITPFLRDHTVAETARYFGLSKQRVREIVERFKVIALESKWASHFVGGDATAA